MFLLSFKCLPSPENSGEPLKTPERNKDLTIRAQPAHPSKPSVPYQLIPPNHPCPPQQARPS